MLMLDSLYLNIYTIRLTILPGFSFDNDKFAKKIIDSSFCQNCFAKYNYLLLLFDVLTINATPIKITIVAIIVR